MLVKNNWNNKIYEVLEINKKGVVLKREDNTTFTLNVSDYVFNYKKLEKK
jgi:3-hydroxy-3-methylglutaryl CoA synthase